MMSQPVILDGTSLSLQDLCDVASRKRTAIIPEAVYEVIERACATLDSRIERGEIIYGVNTGFGKFANTNIQHTDLAALQLNLLRSHSCGVGELLPIRTVRSMLALRINSLVRGHSGVTVDTLRTLVLALEKDCLPPIPSQGSVGASGDLCPLAHLVLPFTGDPGQLLWSPSQQTYTDAGQVIREFGIQPLVLQRKEGLALINGTQFITAITAEALRGARSAWWHSLLAAAMSLEAMRGVPAVFDSRIHAIRPHKGQVVTATIMRGLLLDEKGDASRLNHTLEGKSQDAYSLRCIPQILGPCVEIMNLVEHILVTEINSVTDNPLVFPNDNVVLSGGNFHGQYPAKAADMLALVIPDICNASERRVARLVDSSLSRGLPAFLVKPELGGLHSGMMIPAYTAAALCSENKCLAHPSSVDTIPTCANQEDHVSMGAYSARKALQSAHNAEVVVAIELLVAAQGLDMLSAMHPGVVPSVGVMQVMKAVRACVPVLETDRDLSVNIRALVELIRSEELMSCFGNDVIALLR